MLKTWVIYTLMLGYGVPTHDEARFTNESGCQLYLHTTYGEDVIKAFKLYCEDVSPPLCQGKPCD